MTEAISTELPATHNVIEIIAPSSAEFDQEKINKSIAKLQSYGFKVNFPNDLFGADLKYEANTASYRFNHLIKASNDSSMAILACRGGYSSAKVAELIMNSDINLPQIKHIGGFSDLTALFLALNKKFGWLCVHGPVLTSFANDDANPNSLQQMVDILSNKTTTLSLSNLSLLNDVILNNSLNGKLAGGNLALLISSLGTSWQLDCDGKILFIEHVSDAAYRVDRLLTQLLQANILKNVKAIVFGAFYKPDDNATTKELVNYALKSFANEMAKVNCPVFKTDNFGHYNENTPIVIGATARFSEDSSKNDASQLVAEYSMDYSWESLG